MSLLSKISHSTEGPHVIHSAIHQASPCPAMLQTQILFLYQKNLTPESQPKAEALITAEKIGCEHLFSFFLFLHFQASES